MSKNSSEKMTLTIFNTEIDVPVFESKEKTIEIGKNLEAYMLELYKEYRILHTQMIAVRTAYDLFVALERLKKDLIDTKEVTLEVFEELTARISKIKANIEDSLNFKDSNEM